MSPNNMNKKTFKVKYIDPRTHRLSTAYVEAEDENKAYEAFSARFPKGICQTIIEQKSLVMRQKKELI